VPFATCGMVTGGRDGHCGASSDRARQAPVGSSLSPIRHLIMMGFAKSSTHPTDLNPSYELFLPEESTEIAKPVKALAIKITRQITEVSKNNKSQMKWMVPGRSLIGPVR
jgi:hypothetical protein